MTDQGTATPQFRTRRPAVTTARITIVVPVTVATWRQPRVAIAGSDVPSPSAAIAINSPQVDASIKGALICAKTGATATHEGAMLFSTQSATKTSAKVGNGIRAASLVTDRRANDHPITSTTGNSRKTRNSFTMTAVLPVGSETA